MHKRDQKGSSNKVFPLLAGMFLALSLGTPSDAEIDDKLLDPYLQRHFQWAMFIETKDLKPYMNYPGSKLNPLTRIRVTVNSFQRGIAVPPTNTPAQVYEEFWYHEATPIGLRRYRNLDLKPNQSGAIFIGGRGDNFVAAAKVLVRVALELNLQDRAPAVVQVPLDKYDSLVSELASYSFLPKIPETEGRQFSIHLRSYPYSKNKDNYYFLQN